jgi:polysulfide reductase chain C
MPVALDLSFAGLGAGLFLVAVLADLFGGERCRGIRRVGGILAPWPALLGLVLLVIDLADPQGSWESAMRAGPGFLTLRPGLVMSWGTRLLVAFSIASLCYFVPSLVRWPSKGDGKARRVIGALGLPFGLLVAIYAGVLMAGTAIPLWNTPMLPVLFAGSALLAGLATVVMLLGLRPGLGLRATNESVMGTLLRGQSALAVVVLVLSLVYVGIVAGRDGGAAHANSALWWVFVVALGLAVPLVYGLARPRTTLATPVVAALTVLGAFFLRYTILIGGQA